MKVAVVGSRSITNYDTVETVMNTMPDHWTYDDMTIVSGGADGVDTSAERYAKEHGFGIEVIEPNYQDWSNGHPAIWRNTKIVEESDAVVAIWDGHSNGTRDTIDKALDRGKPLYVEVM